MLLDTAFTIEPSKIAKLRGMSSTDALSRNERLEMLQDELLKQFIKHEPTTVASESPFLGRFPQAFAALVECVAIERAALRSYASEKLLVMITPPTVKVGAGVHHSSNDKEDMREALENIQDVDLNGINVDLLDEHAIDAVHVARAAISQAYGLLVPHVKAKKRKRRKKTNEKATKSSKGMSITEYLRMLECAKKFSRM